MSERYEAERQTAQRLDTVVERWAKVGGQLIVVATQLSFILVVLNQFSLKQRTSPELSAF